MRTVLITGVSTGIGKSIAIKLLENNFYVIGTVRRTEDARELESLFKDKFKSIILDVTDKEAIYNSVEKSVGDLDIVFASTSRIRKINKETISITNLKKKIKKGRKIGILFGPEASGLSNDEISCADYLVKIPSNKEFSSLNLSHSAIIFCYELFQHFSKRKSSYKTSYKSSIAKKSEVEKFLSFIIKGLDKKGFLQPMHKRQSMIRNIKNIFHRLNLSEQEIRILLGIFSTLNKINKKT